MYWFSTVQTVGTSQGALKTAYQAAASAASQLPAGKKQYLVTAGFGPTFSHGGYTVHTRPLGFRKHLSNEQVRMRWKCMKLSIWMHHQYFTKSNGLSHVDLRA